MSCDELELYLKENIQSGNTGYFKDVSFEKTSENDKVVITGELSMRYLEFLTNKYLNEKEKNSYELCYNRINNEIMIIRSLGMNTISRQFFFYFYDLKKILIYTKAKAIEILLGLGLGGILKLR